MAVDVDLPNFNSSSVSLNIECALTLWVCQRYMWACESLASTLVFIARSSLPLNIQTFAVSGLRGTVDGFGCWRLGDTWKCSVAALKTLKQKGKKIFYSAKVFPPWIKTNFYVRRQFFSTCRHIYTSADPISSTSPRLLCPIHSSCKRIVPVLLSPLWPISASHYYPEKKVLGTLWAHKLQSVHSMVLFFRRWQNGSPDMMWWGKNTEQEDDVPKVQYSRAL